jgi:hypothetical protein
MGLPEEIVALGRHSRSAELAHTVKKTMFGVTWHCHYHLRYDLRTMLVPVKKVHLEIGVYDGGSLSFMMQHSLRDRVARSGSTSAAGSGRTYARQREDIQCTSATGHGPPEIFV